MSTSTLNTDKDSGVESAANLKPKEHGAYAILAIPMLTAIISAGQTIVGICVAGASIAGFLAHEPLLVALGHRGARAQRTTPAAQHRLGVLLWTTVICGVVAIVIGSTDVRYALVACGVLALISFMIAIAGKHRTLGGQLWGIVGLSVPCVPILLAGQQSPLLTVEAWATWLIGFGATTLAVRGVIAAQKRQTRAFHMSVVGGLSVAVAVLTASGFTLPIVTLPMVAMAWYLLFAPPPAKQLRRVGWSLVAGTVASACWMAAIL